MSEGIAIGSGKSFLSNDRRVLEGYDREAYEEAKAAESDIADMDESNQRLADWFNSMTEAENAEYARLVEEADKVDDEYMKCIGADEASRPQGCRSVASGLSKDCVLSRCPVFERHIKAHEAIRDYADSHGNHCCGDCKYHGFAMSGHCYLKNIFRKLGEAACEYFATETDDEMSQRLGMGIYETDEDRAKREAYERRHAKEIAAESKERRRRSAERFVADSRTFSKDGLLTLLNMNAGYYRRLYDEFPKVMKRSKYGTFAILAESVGFTDEGGNGND